MYFKWDLFRRHVKKWVNVAKNGFKWLFFEMEKTHIQMLGCLSISPSVRYKLCLSDISLTTEANLMKLHRKIKHNEKVCRAHDLGSYAQGQGCNQVKGQNLVSAITQKLLKQI